MAKRIVIVMF
jgi:hypothetical protein